MPIPIPAIIAATGVLLTSLITPMANAPTPPCVRIGAACYPAIQTPSSAAHDGDAILVPAGRFPGGITIAKSVTLRGAGAGKTVIAGGEHVVTVGTLFAPSGAEPTVSIFGVTITGGHATDFPASDQPHVEAHGGGVLMLPDADWGGGTLTLTDSVVTGNTATPTATLRRCQSGRSGGRDARRASARTRARTAPVSTPSAPSPL